MTQSDKHRSAARPQDLRRRSALAGEAAAATAEVEHALALPVDDGAAAFFDVDNTVMQGASIFHFAKGLYKRKFFGTKDILGAVYKQAYFRFAGVEDPAHIAEARESALSFIKGHTVAELEDLGEEIFDEAMAHRIWPGTRALAQMHLDLGQRVWLVTAAPIEIASTIARRLGLTGAMGTVAEREGGVYTRSPGGRPVARALQGGGHLGAGRARRTRPEPLLGLLGLLQRPADAVARGPPGGHQPRLRPAGPRPTPGLGDP